MRAIVEDFATGEAREVDLDYADLPVVVVRFLADGGDPDARAWLDAEVETAHLSGKHDQKSHAHGGGGLPSGWRFTPEDRFVGYDTYRNDSGDLLVGIALDSTGRQVISPGQRAEVLSTMGSLGEKYPGHKVSMTVEAISLRVGGAYGYTLGGTGGHGYVSMDPKVFSGEHRRAFAAGVEKGDYPPAAKGSSLAGYVMTHEYGHTLQPADPKALTSSVRSAVREGGPSPSTYGRPEVAMANEAFAEGFTEFTLSGGTTTNGFSQVLAADQGWVS